MVARVDEDVSIRALDQLAFIEALQHCPATLSCQPLRHDAFSTTGSGQMRPVSRPFPVPQSTKEAALSYSLSASKSRRCRPRARRQSPAGAGCSCRCCRARRRAAGHDAARAAAAARLHLHREKTLISSREQTTTNGLHMTSRRTEHKYLGRH